MIAIEPHTRVRQAADILASDVAGETVLMNPELGEYYSLDPVASDIWRRIARGITLQDLVEELTDHYNGDASVVREDTLALLGTLAAKRLIIVGA